MPLIVFSPWVALCIIAVPICCVLACLKRRPPPPK